MLIQYLVCNSIVYKWRIIHVVHCDINKIINKSINQSLSRTINTSLTTLLPVMTLLFFGGTVIRGFALALLIGVIIGTYSSIFVVSPIVVYWYYRNHPGMKKKEQATA